MVARSWTAAEGEPTDLEFLRWLEYLAQSDIYADKDLTKVARPREFDYDDVVEQAMYLFWRQGYQNTSIDDVESTTGLTKGSPNHDSSRRVS